jgi:hypothetical protein
VGYLDAELETYAYKIVWRAKVIHTYLNNNVRNTRISQRVAPAGSSDFSTGPDVLDTKSAVDLLEISFDLGSLGLIGLALKPNISSCISGDTGKGNFSGIGQSCASNISSDGRVNGRFAMLGTQDNNSVVEESKERFGFR